jgi:hypothetical protein
MMNILNNYNLICFEKSENLYSLSINSNNLYIYKEFEYREFSSKLLLNFFNDFFIENYLCFYNLNCLVIGSNFSSMLNFNVLLSFLKSLFFGLKIPIIQVNSIFSVALEMFIKYRIENIIIIKKISENNFYIGEYNFFQFYKFKVVYEKIISNIEDLYKISFNKNSLFISNYKDLKYYINDIGIKFVFEYLFSKAFYINKLAQENFKSSIFTNVSKIYNNFDYSFHKKYKMGINNEKNTNKF